MSETVLITGGSGPIGLTIARALAEAGYSLVLVARRDEPLRAAARATGARAIPWNVARDPEALLDIASPVHHLVHCAGQRPPLPPDAWSMDEFRRMIDLFVGGPALLTRAFATRAPGGRVVFVAPALRPEPGNGPWLAARAAALALIPALEQELGLRCGVVAAGGEPGAAALAFLRGDLA